MSPIRDFPGVQWLRLHASTTGGLDSISGWRTKIPHTSGHSQKKVSPINSEAAAAAAKSLQSCLTLCDPIDGSPPGSPIPGILQARALEWVSISFSNFLQVKSESEVAQSCPTLSDTMDCSLPGSPTHGIFQARILEWFAFSITVKHLSRNLPTVVAEVPSQGIWNSFLTCT